jgi:hypothetical protein
MREFRVLTVFESISLMARVATFNTHVDTILQPLLQLVNEGETVEGVERVERALRSAASGFRRNPSVTAEDLLGSCLPSASVFVSRK